MKSNIIIRALEKELAIIQKKRNILHAKLYPEKDYMIEICEINIEFGKLLKEFGGNSEEVRNFVKNNVEHEQELRKLAKWQCDNLLKYDDKLFRYSQQIGELKTKLYYERRI